MTAETPRDDVLVADGGTDLVDDSREEGGTAEELDHCPQDGVSPDDIDEFLLEVVRRRPLLRSLRSGSATTSDLLESVDMSRSTLHRAINSLEDRDLVEESGGEYRLTSVGTMVTEETEAFGTHTAAALSLDKFLNSIDGHAGTVPVEYFTDATVVRRKARQPHATIHRIIEFIEDAERLRMFSTVISPVYVDVGYREMMDGMEIEAIFDREVIEIMLAEYPEKAYETITTGNFDVYAHDGLPFELFISEEKVGMAAHNANSNAEILVECDDPAAVAWAEDVYSRHISDADPVSL
ncbi:helix-turn-helix transcriptional regulator [Halobacterium wangiae]|uniref:helix-turn-helix transcriptional regulator n=1 Tax=Halobacterium wangiae TaxID=2902623 RepID=UPI001E58943E|nr:winged helix-turn-helix domain-containing protein [Halobacterium wangiae]